AWWMSTVPLACFTPFCISSPSSEFDRFSIWMVGKRACSRRARLVSLLEPVIWMDFCIFLSWEKESCSLKVLGFCSSPKTRKKPPICPLGGPTLFKLFVVLVPIVVPLGLEVQFSVKGFLQVDARLVGQAEDHEDHIGQFLPQVLGPVGLLLALFPVPSGDDPRYFPHLLGELSHIGEFVEVAHPVLLYPLIDGFLGVLYVHGCEFKGYPKNKVRVQSPYSCSMDHIIFGLGFNGHSLFLVSIRMVTGPSLSSSTFMWAPKTPLPTVLPRSCSIFFTTAS